MKNYIIVLLSALLLINLTGCQDELADNFVDPSVYTPEDQDVPSGMFAEIMSRTRTFKNDYGEFWWHADAGGMITHSHFIMRFLRSSYTWYTEANDIEAFYTTMNVDSYFYGHNSDFRELPTMIKYVSSMSEQSQLDNQIYVTITEMVRGYRASKAVDLFNDVPYSEGLQGVDGVFFPKFDNARDIYFDIINDLDSLSDAMIQQEAKMSVAGKATFAKQDIIFQGDVTKWKQWAAALRLRLAVRISGVEETYASQVIQEIIQSGDLPAADLFIPANDWVSDYRSHWKLGVAERDYAGFIPPTIMYKLDKDQDHKYTAGVDDPRLPVYFLPNRDTLYMPVSLDFTVGQKIYNYVKAQNIADYNYGDAYYYYNYFQTLDNYMKYNGYSMWNPATMVQNQEPWRAFTRSEVDFLLAEVQLKGLAQTGSSVEDHLRNGVINSINYWYYINSFSAWDKINSSNTSFLKPTAPSQSIKEQCADMIVGQYDNAANEEDKMEVIIAQKYLHLCIHDYLEVFTELRRTRHPKLALIRYSSSFTVAPEVERYPYPSGESSYNSDALREVADEDNFTSPIFWVPADKASVSYYDAAFNSDYMYTKYPGVPESFPGN